MVDDRNRPDGRRDHVHHRLRERGVKLDLLSGRPIALGSEKLTAERNVAALAVIGPLCHSDRGIQSFTRTGRGIFITVAVIAVQLDRDPAVIIVAKNRAAHRSGGVDHVGK